jgi:hypothetical protein
MNRWDWLKGVVGMSGEGEKTGVIDTAAIERGFQRIAAELNAFSDRFDTQIFDMRSEMQGFQAAMNTKYRDLIQRVQTLEPIVNKLQDTVFENSDFPKKVVVDDPAI